MKSGRTVCRIYKKAMQARDKPLGHILATYIRDGEKMAVRCKFRSQRQFNYDDCPFNDDKVETYETYLKRIGVKIPWKRGDNNG